MKRLLRQLAFIGDMQVEELAARMGHAADFGDAHLEAGLVAGEVVTYQLAVPGAQEVTRMFAGTAAPEVDHGFECRKGRRAVGLDIGAVGFLLAWRQHLYRRFIGVNHALGQHHFVQRIDQGLKLHASLAHPLCQGRTRNGQTDATEDLFLSIQRQVVGELGHHHMGQQARRGDALVDYLRRHRRLDLRFALAAGPSSTNVLFDGEHARRVVQLLTDIFPIR